MANTFTIAGLMFFYHMPNEDFFEDTKEAVLAHVGHLFEEMEGEAAMRHQEKYTLLEDAFDAATDGDELRVAFEQWYGEHAEELELDDAETLWGEAVGGLVRSVGTDDEEES